LLTTIPKTTQSRRVMMPPSNLGARASIATAWHWVGSPDGFDAAVEQHAQHGPAIVRRSPDQEVVGDVAPGSLEPLDIGFEAAGCRHEAGGADFVLSAFVLDDGRYEHAAVDVEADDFGVVGDIDTELFRREIEGVEHRPAAAEEERIGPAEAEGAAERGLEADALLGDPGQHLLRFMDHEPGQILVGTALGDQEEIVPELILGVGTGEDFGRGVVGAAHVAGVARVAAPVELGRPFQDKHRGAGVPGADRRAERRISPAYHQDVVSTFRIDHLRPFPPLNR
jgi:hypothetical protein